MIPSSSNALVEPQEAPADGSQGSPPEERTTGAATPPAALGNAIPFMTVLLTIATSMAVTLPELVAVFNPDEPAVQQIILDVAGGVAFVAAMACEYL